MQSRHQFKLFNNTFCKLTLFAGSLAFFALSACAPKNMIEGVPWVVARQGESDASAQRVAHWPCIRFDSVLLDDLEAATANEDLVEAKQAVHAVLTRAHQLAITITHDELDRLDDEGWADLRNRYFTADETPHQLSPTQMRQDFLARTEDRFGSLNLQFDKAASIIELRLVADNLMANLEESIKTHGRVARALPWLLFTAPSKIAIASIYKNEYRGSLDRPFSASVRYLPQSTPSDSPAWRLLNQYAPIIIQEINPEAEYDPSIDRMGTVTARAPEELQIDTSAPAVYAYARDLTINSQRHTQLIYTTWYPEHPNLKNGNDAEVGHIDGSILRITLNTDKNPILFETMLACGCYHRTYPTTSLEESARRIHGAPLEGKSYSIERPVKGKYDLIVPALVNDEYTPDARLHVRAAAGYHALINIAFNTDAHPDENPTTTDNYLLRPYAELTHLELPEGRITSMFYDNGLVKGAQRLEGVYFTPAGILSAGQPRQRGTHLIHWDNWDFDDPNLFEQSLRWPLNTQYPTRQVRAEPNGD